MLWKKGDQLNGGHYIIEKRLGTGGFGITYFAKDNKGNKFVIKTLKEELQEKDKIAKFREGLKDEALGLHRCEDPHIVRFQECFNERVDNDYYKGKLPCIVMEYIEGEDLEQLVENNQDFLKESEALKYICQIGQALKVVHNKGLLHRDIKPQNIIIRANTSEAVLIDFGIARSFISNITISHTGYNTCGYAPPEQYEEKAKRGGFIDVYGLAATLYYLLTKTVPIDSRLRYSPAFASKFKTAKEINPEISDRVNQAIIKGMELDSRQRPETIQSWLELLGTDTVYSSETISESSSDSQSDEATVNEQGQKVKSDENYVSQDSKITIPFTNKKITEIYNQLPPEIKNVLNAILSGFTKQDILSRLSINESNLKSSLEQLHKDFQITVTEEAGENGEVDSHFTSLIAFFEKHLPSSYSIYKSSNAIPLEVFERFIPDEQADNQSSETDIIKPNENQNQQKVSPVSYLMPDVVDLNGYASTTGTTTIKILIIAANPQNTSRLRLDEEVREIREVLRYPTTGLDFKVEELWAVRFRDLRRAMLEFKPNIIHFSGHGAGDDGLILEDDSGRVKLMSPEALSGLFELFKHKIYCAVFNACYSEIQAQAITQHINYVVGMDKVIGDRAAIYFATSFYETIAKGYSVDDAFKMGCISIQAEGIPESSTPKLLKNSSPKLISISDKLAQNENVSSNHEEQINPDSKLPLILVLAANPKGTSFLRIDQEVREIKEQLRNVKLPSFSIEQRWAFRPRDFQKVMLELQPEIVHFSGHGEGEKGIVVEDEQGQMQLITPDALARHFQPYANQINCIVINACYSGVHAKAISEHINYVIGMSQEIGDKAAIAFSIGFYRALAYNMSIENAFELGCREIELQVGTEYETPRIYRKQERIVTATTPKITATPKIEDEIQPNDTEIKKLSSGEQVMIFALSLLIQSGSYRLGSLLLQNYQKLVARVARVQERNNLEETESKEIKTHQDLEVYKMAFDAAMKIGEVCKKPPGEKCDSLIEKVCSSSRLVCARLAEAYRKRRNRNAFVAKLNDCEKKVTETQVLIEFAAQSNYCDAHTSQEICEIYNQILDNLENMRNNPSPWLINYD